MRNIAVVTGTRAEYYLLRNIMREIEMEKSLNLQLIVTGTHLSETYGMTINEITADKFKIDEVCPILMDYEGSDKTAKEMSIAVNEFSRAFSSLHPDLILILGDRYEILAAAVTALLMNIPMAHISGGEITEGAVDDQIRHAITKISHIHFPGAEVYAENIISMGEEPWRVFLCGDPAIENIKKSRLLSKKEIAESLKIDIDDETLLVTYHPVTLERNEVEMQIKNLIRALDLINKETIITYPNSDSGSEIIISYIEDFASRKDNVHLFKNLGSRKYLSIMKYCRAVVGNSSSALVEAPLFKKPAVNIGNRQKGRLMADNIIQVSNASDDIYEGIKKAFSREFLDNMKNVKSLYDEGETSKEIVKVLKSISIDEKLLIKKFYKRQ